MVKIGNRLRALRVERGLTHRELGTLIGLSDGQLSRIENNKSEPEVGTLKALADYFGVTMDDMLDPVEAAETLDVKGLEDRLMDAASRAQKGEADARAEMRRLYAALGRADAARVERERLKADEKRRRKGT